MAFLSLLFLAPLHAVCDSHPACAPSLPPARCHGTPPSLHTLPTNTTTAAPLRLSDTSAADVSPATWAALAQRAGRPRGGLAALPAREAAAFDGYMFSLVGARVVGKLKVMQRCGAPRRGMHWAAGGA